MKKVFTQQGRNKKDVAMLSISIFAAVGGVFVFRSFAAKKYDTTKPGVVPIAALQVKGTQNDISLQFEVRNGGRYCFGGPSGTSGEVYPVSLQNGRHLALQFNEAKGMYCFVSPADSTAEIPEKGLVGSFVTLVVE